MAAVAAALGHPPTFGSAHYSDSDAHLRKRVEKDPSEGDGRAGGAREREGIVEVEDRDHDDGDALDGVGNRVSHLRL